MNLIQASQLSQAARAKGLATEAFSGKVRFVTVSYNKLGKSTVLPVTEFLDYNEAQAALKTLATFGE